MRLLTSLTLIAACTFAAGRLSAQERNVPDSLVSKAKVSEDSARNVAVKRVPGDVQAITLAKAHSRLVYTFKIQRSGKTPGVSDVQVSAMTGKVLSVRRESAKKKSTTRRSS